MALKQLMLTRERKEKTALLETIEKEQEALREQREAWKLRESNAEKALEELEGKPDATEEERKAFDDEAAEIEKEDGELTGKEEDAQKRADEARNRIKKIDEELEDIRKRFVEGSKSAKGQEKKPAENHNERGVYVDMDKRERMIELVKREDVRHLLTNVRTLMQRGITGEALTIPQVMLPMITEVISRYSVLEKYMNTETISGDAVQNIMVGTPEAVWTEALGWIKELDLNIAQIKTYGNTVAGFFPLRKAAIEDSDEDLAAIVVEALGRSIGLGKDKAMLYGTGVGMPVGIATRLTATTKPTWWDTMWAPTNRPEFKSVAASNIGAISEEGLEPVKLYKEMAGVLGKVKRVYETGGTGGKFWAMAGTTWADLQINMLAMNSAGAIVSAANKQMPVIGGNVEELDFIPDGVIIGGFGGNYMWVNRSGVRIESDSGVRFLQDQVMTKGVARADGCPMAGEAFAMFNIKSTTKPTANMTFNEGKTSREEEVLGEEAEG